MTVSIKPIKSYKLFKRLDNQGTASAKEMYAKEKGALQEQVQSSLRKETCPFATVALQTWGFFIRLQLKGELLKTSRTEH